MWWKNLIRGDFIVFRIIIILVAREEYPPIFKDEYFLEVHSEGNFIRIPRTQKDLGQNMRKPNRPKSSKAKILACLKIEASTLLHSAPSFLLFIHYL